MADDEHALAEPKPQEQACLTDFLDAARNRNGRSEGSSDRQ
jgi:hypothetical protein